MKRYGDEYVDLNGERRPNIVLIIGNGFDLDLGLNTRFSDFAKSSYWPVDIEIHDNYIVQTPLKTFLDKYKEMNDWFDLEYALIEYANPKKITERPIMQRGLKPNVDIECFQQIHAGLISYLSEESKKNIDSKSYAAQVIKAMMKSKCFLSVYSFNYTDLDAFAEKMGLQHKFEVCHVHGKLSDRSIIIGVDDTELTRGYENFHKYMSPFYSPNNLFKQLKEADEVIFFGLSFGDIDFHYFEDYIKLLTNKNDEENEFRHVTIFTYDEDSRKNILKSFESHGIKMFDLFQTHVEFIKTIDGPDNSVFQSFLGRLAVG